MHVGDGDTWRSCRNYTHRIDYIVLPIAWQSFCISSEVLHGLEAMQMREDHLPVKATVRCSRSVSDSAYTDCRRRAIRPPPAANPAERLQRQDYLRSLPSCPWHADVDRQYAFFAQVWQRAGQTLQPAQERHVTQPFLSDTTLDLVQWCKALRRYLRLESRERARRWLLIGFAAFRMLWEGHAYNQHTRHTADTWLRDIDLSESCAVSLLTRFVRSTRQSVAQDRVQYLQSLVQQISLHDLKRPADLYKAVRRAFPTARSARRSAMRPLPAVLDEQGNFAATPEARAECWRRHFATQEAGTEVSPSEYLQAFQGKSVSTCELDLTTVPTLSDLESIILGLKSHKAAGPDGLSPDLFRLSPVAAARAMIPITTKTVFALREPIEYRGGTLICLAKRVGASLQCSHFRSILISATPAKVYHRYLRNKMLPFHASHKPPLQLGALGGAGIETIALAARTFQLQKHARRQPWGIVFVDVQAAFYRVIRQLITPHQDDDRSLLQLFHRLGLPAKAIEALYEQLHKLSILTTIGVPAQLMAQIQDIMTATWFRIDMHAVLTLTACGTRPGDPAADLLFALAFGEFLRVISDDVSRHGLEPTLSVPASRHEWAVPEGPQSLGAPAWADDFFLPQTGDDASDLIGRTRQTVEIVTGRATSLGMRLTFATNKTALLLPPSHDWEQASPHVTTCNGDVGVTILDCVSQEPQHMPIVQTYKHLGGILTSTTTPRPDILLRRSQALGTVKPLRRQLFENRDIPLAVRRTLLKALSVSKLVHSAASLIYCLRLSTSACGSVPTSRCCVPLSSVIPRTNNHTVC